ncbi:MAG: DoxX family protein [Opitutaceae bacterium]
MPPKTRAKMLPDPAVPRAPDAPPQGRRSDAVFDAMERYVRLYFRYALAVIFVWFGALKIVGESPIAELVSRTLPFLPPQVALVGLGWLEVVIGVCFLFRRTVRIALGLLLLQLPGTFASAVVAPELCFDGNPFLLTLEGEFVVKNLLIVGAALLLGGSLRPTERPVASPEIRK